MALLRDLLDAIGNQRVEIVDGAEVHHFGAAAAPATVTFPDRDLAAVGAGFRCDGVIVRTTAAHW